MNICVHERIKTNSFHVKLQKVRRYRVQWQFQKNFNAVRSNEKFKIVTFDIRRIYCTFYCFSFFLNLQSVTNTIIILFKKFYPLIFGQLVQFISINLIAINNTYIESYIFCNDKRRNTNVKHAKLHDFYFYTTIITRAEFVCLFVQTTFVVLPSKPIKPSVLLLAFRYCLF